MSLSPTLIDELNRRHRLRMHDPVRSQGGLQGGAWVLRDSDHDQLVLKVRPDDRSSFRTGALPMVNGLVAAGYPTPRWLAAGVSTAGDSYIVQQWIPGRPMTADDGLLSDLLMIIESQANQAPKTDRNWSNYVAGVPRDDDGLVTRLRSFGRPGVDLAAHFLSVLATVDVDEALPGGDAVHGDLNTCNVLVHDGAISGIIDIEAMGRGSRVIDYGWLLREAHLGKFPDHQIVRIRQAGEAVAGRAALVRATVATGIDIAVFVARRDALDPDTISRLHGLADDLS